jgi:hypothetical protein
MNIKYIQVGQWFKIDCQSAEGAYQGSAMVINSNPAGYPDETFEVLCEDGELGFFSADQFFAKIQLPDAVSLNSILLKLLQNRPQ